MGINNFFNNTEVGEATTEILLVQTNTDSKSSCYAIHNPIENFNNDKDFANFQLGEFGLTQDVFISHDDLYIYLHC